VSAEREQPESGADWDVSAAMSERCRFGALERAEYLEGQGDAEAGAFWREAAERHRKNRDRHQRDYEMKTLDRRAHRRW
jgi:hypothetical protein